MSRIQTLTNTNTGGSRPASYDSKSSRGNFSGPGRRLGGGSTSKSYDPSRYSGKVILSADNQGITDSYLWAAKSQGDRDILDSLYKTGEGSLLPALHDGTQNFTRATFIPDFNRSRHALFTLDPWSSQVSSKMIQQRSGTREERKRAKQGKKKAAAQKRAASSRSGSSTSKKSRPSKGSKSRRRSKAQSFKKQSRASYVWEDPVTGEDTGRTSDIQPPSTQFSQLKSARDTPPDWLLPENTEDLSVIHYTTYNDQSKLITRTWEKSAKTGTWQRSETPQREVRSRIKHMGKRGPRGTSFRGSSGSRTRSSRG